MDALLLVARLVLAAVFTVAALSKLTDRGDFAATVHEFGIRSRAVAGAMSVLIPLGELAIAVLLVPTGTARIAAVAATGLLAAFSLGIALALRRGEQPDCGCFGSRPSPVGYGSLLRNAALGVAAAAVVIAGPGEPIGAVTASGESAAIAGCVLAILVLALLGYQLFEQNGRLLERVDALEAAERLRSAGIEDQLDPQLHVEVRGRAAERIGSLRLPAGRS